MILAESYTDLMTDPAHMAFELSYEFLTALVLYPAIRWMHKRLKDSIHREIDTEHGVTHITVNTSVAPDVQAIHVEQAIREAANRSWQR